MELDPDTLSSREAYKFLTSAVVPRPIGWTSTVSEDGAMNLAPFSFFNAISSRPPMVVLGIGRRRDGRHKDTARNILETGHFVVNIVTEELAERMKVSAERVEPEIDEFELSGLTPAPATKVDAPRVQEAKLSIECTLAGRADLDIDYDILFGTVEHYHVDEAIIGEDGLVDPEKLAPVARLGGVLYSTLGEIFDLEDAKETLAAKASATGKR